MPSGVVEQLSPCPRVPASTGNVPSSSPEVALAVTGASFPAQGQLNTTVGVHILKVLLFVLVLDWPQTTDVTGGKNQQGESAQADGDPPRVSSDVWSCREHGGTAARPANVGRGQRRLLVAAPLCLHR